MPAFRPTRALCDAAAYGLVNRKMPKAQVRALDLKLKRLKAMRSQGAVDAAATAAAADVRQTLSRQLQSLEALLADAAAWLRNHRETLRLELNGEPIRLTGKVLTADKLLCVAQAIRLEGGSL